MREKYTARQLLKAIRQGDAATVRACLENGINPDVRTGIKKKSAIELAFQYRNFEIVWDLYRSGAGYQKHFKYGEYKHYSLYEAALVNSRGDFSPEDPARKLAEALKAEGRDFIYWYDDEGGVLEKQAQYGRKGAFLYWLDHIKNYTHLTKHEDDIIKACDDEMFLAFEARKKLLASKIGLSFSGLKENEEESCKIDGQTLEIQKPLSDNGRLIEVFNFISERLYTITRYPDSSHTVIEDFENISGRHIKRAARQLYAQGGKPDPKWLNLSSGGDKKKKPVALKKADA